MSELTNFLKSLGKSVDNSLPEEDENITETIEEPVVTNTEPPVEEETDSELDAFIKRINEKNQKEVINLDEQTSTISDNVVPLPGGELAIDVTEQAKAGSTAANPTRDYDYFYNEQGEYPSIGIFTKIGAIVGDIFNPENMPNASQQERDAIVAKQNEFMDRAQKIYDGAMDYTLPEAKLLGIDLTGFADDELFSDGKVKVYMYLGEDGEPKYTLLPNPNSSSFERIVDQAGRNIFQETFGLVERDEDGSLDLNILEDSEYAKAVPDLDQPLVEGLATDLLTYGVPGVGAYKVGKGTVGAVTKVGSKADDLIGTSKLANKARNVAGKFDDALQYTGGSLAVAFTEGVLSQEGDQGLIVSPEWVKSQFTGLSDEAAKDVAMIMDGFVVNGAFDTVLGLGLGAFRLGRDKLRDSRGLFSKRLVEDKAQRAALFGVLKEIDPDFGNMSQQELVANLRNLANVLNANSKAIAVVGQTTKEIDVDTANALLRGGKNYIMASKQRLLNTMKPAERERYIQQEADKLVSRIVGIARGNMDNAGLRNQQAQMLEDLGSTFTDEASRINPNNVDFNTQTAPELVDQRNVEILDAQAEADAAKAQSDQFKADAGKAVENDPFIQELLADADPVRFFNDTKYVDALRKLYGEDFVNEYRKAYENVNAAYDAIPNDPVDITALKTQLSNVFNNAGGLGEVGQDAAPIITSLKRVFKDKIDTPTDNLQLADPQAPAMTLETPQQIIDGLTGDIGYQDLVALKRELDTLIGSANNRNVSTALQELRKHILSAEVGGQAAYVARNGGKAAEMVKEADDLFIDTQSRFQNALTTRSLSDAANLPAYAGSNTRIPEGGSRRGQPDLETQAVNEITPAATSDRTGNQIEQLRFALSSTLSRGEVNKPFIDLFVAEQTDLLAKALRNNDQQTIAEIDKAFSGIITELKNLEAMDLVTELDNAKMRILSVQEELGDRALAADKVAEMALERKIAAENTVVSRLLSKNKRGAVQSTPSMTIRSELMGADAGNFIDGLMEEINKLPVDQKGAALAATQSMLLRTIRDITSTATPIAPGGKKDVALGTLERITNPEANGLIDAVSRAFPDDPIMKETIMATLGSMSDVSLASRMKVARAGSDTAANLGIRDSVSTGILFAFGYMNPTAAAARRITATQIEAMEKLGKETQDNIIATVLASPKEFADLATLIANGADPSTIQRAKDLFLSSANRTMQYQIRVDEAGNEDEQTNRMLYDSATGVIDKAMGIFD